MKSLESKNTSYAFSLMLSSYLVTLVILLAETLSNPPETAGAGIMFILPGLGIWLFKILPLLLFIPGLIQRSHKAAAWLSYMSMLYFILAVLLAFTPGASGFGWAMVLSSLVLFISSMMFTRWKKADEKKIKN